MHILGLVYPRVAGKSNRLSGELSTNDAVDSGLDRRYLMIASSSLLESPEPECHHAGTILINN